METGDAARILLASRYLLPGETPEEMLSRVAEAVGGAKPDQYLGIMRDRLFLPNSPTLMNAGTPNGQLSACFVLPIEDSIHSIFTTLAQMALIHKSGGGTGFSFSRIRPRGDTVGGTAGVASGPVPFIQVFDNATSALKQGGRRRGANMGVLSCAHPDIFEFIHAKEGGGLRNFNLSVGFDASFFPALSKGSSFDLVNPRDGEVFSSVPSSVLWDDLVRAAWKCGDPGVLFLDRINEKNPVPGLGRIEATNPCGEQPLLPYESCNLGSINISRCIRKNEIDFALLGQTVRLSVEFLDSVIDVNRFPLPMVMEQTMKTRKVGLGVMGLADAFIAMGIPYASDEGIRSAETIMKFIQEEAHARSEELGREKGSFPAIDQSIYNGEMRNATVTTIAPTGSLHLIAGTSSGIEPIFSLAFNRRINNHTLSFIHPLLEEKIKNRKGREGLMDRIRKTGSVQDLPVGEEIRELFRTAPEIEPVLHVRMQAAVQKYVDNAVSKTVNLPSNATEEEVSRIFQMARELGCKGVTIYRYSSRADQVLSRGCDACRADIFSG